MSFGVKRCFFHLRIVFSNRGGFTGDTTHKRSFVNHSQRYSYSIKRRSNNNDGYVRRNTAVVNNLSSSVNRAGSSLCLLIAIVPCPGSLVLEISEDSGEDKAFPAQATRLPTVAIRQTCSQNLNLGFQVDFGRIPINQIDISRDVLRELAFPTRNLSTQGSSSHVVDAYFQQCQSKIHRCFPILSARSSPNPHTEFH